MRLITKISACLLAVMSIAASASVAAQPVRELPSKIVFSRTINGGQTVDRTLETYSWGTQTLPAHRISWPNSDFLHYTIATARPEQTHLTQSIGFRFRSNGLFASNPGAHFIVSGRAEGSGWGARGRGFIVGGVFATANPCATGARSQPETWWTNQSAATSANYVWNGALCGSALSDNVWYDAYLHLNNNSGFYYEIRQAGVLVGGGTYIVDNVNPENAFINKTPTGFIFGLTQATNLSTPWSLEFDAINVVWF